MDDSLFLSRPDGRSVCVGTDGNTDFLGTHVGQAYSFFIPAVVPFSHLSPHFSIERRTGFRASPFSVRLYARRFEPSSAGTRSAMSCCTSRARRSLRMLVGMPSGDAMNSLNRVRPSNKVAHDEHRPLVANDVQRAGDRAR